jgi:hypothetical protein
MCPCKRSCSSRSFRYQSLDLCSCMHDSYDILPLSSCKLQVTKANGGPSNFLKRSLWWAWQIWLTFMVRYLMNVLNARLSSIVDYLMALPFAYLLESMFFAHKANFTANVTANMSIIYRHHTKLVTIFSLLEYTVVMARSVVIGSLTLCTLYPYYL